MLRNVEIKARVRDFDRITLLAKSLSNSDGEAIPQHDIFYNCSKGRLKLRKFEDGSSTLVYYDRPDEAGPKLSEYEKCDFPGDVGEKLGAVLEKSLGIKGELKKTRCLFMVGQTRVHIDRVEKLGNFMELEVVLTPEQTVEEGLRIASDLQRRLEIPNEDLLSGAYMDML